MYIRFIRRGKTQCGPYLYHSVRKGDKVTGKYMGKYHGSLHSVGVSLANYKPPPNYSTGKQIYESVEGKKYPITVVEDNIGFVKEPYNATLDKKLGVAVFSKNMSVPERVKAELEEAYHMDGYEEGRMGPIPSAEEKAVSAMKKRWRNIPPTEIDKVRGRNEDGEIKHSISSVAAEEVDESNVSPSFDGEIYRDERGNIWEKLPNDMGDVLHHKVSKEPEKTTITLRDDDIMYLSTPKKVELQPKVNIKRLG